MPHPLSGLIPIRIAGRPVAVNPKFAAEHVPTIRGIPPPPDPLPNHSLHPHAYIPSDIAGVIFQHLPRKAYFRIFHTKENMIVLLSREMSDAQLCNFPERFCGNKVKYTRRCRILPSSSPNAAMENAETASLTRRPERIASGQELFLQGPRHQAGKIPKETSSRIIPFSGGIIAVVNVTTNQGRSFTIPTHGYSIPNATVQNEQRHTGQSTGQNGGPIRQRGGYCVGKPTVRSQYILETSDSLE
jgi:hypothetical protein